MTDFVVFKIEDRHKMAIRHKESIEERYIQALVDSRWINIDKTMQFRSKFKDNYCGISVAGDKVTKSKFDQMLREWLADTILNSGFYGFLGTSHSTNPDPSDRRRSITEIVVRFSDERDYIAFEEEFLVLLRLSTNSKR